MAKLTSAIVAITLEASVLASAVAAPLKVETPGPSGPGGHTPVNERFPSLDAYLAYLEKRSHMDGPWYREIRPGVYQLQTGNLQLPDGAREPRTFTREELAKKFGFAR